MVSAHLLGLAMISLNLRAQVSTYKPIIKVEGLTDHGFSTVPPLKPTLSSVFRVRTPWSVGQRVVPPSPSDQLTTRLTDRIHQWLLQAAAAMNNVSMLALSISRKTKMPKLSLAELDELCTAADTITNLCAAQAQSAMAANLLGPAAILFSFPGTGQKTCDPASSRLLLSLKDWTLA